MTALNTAYLFGDFIASNNSFMKSITQKSLNVERRYQRLMGPLAFLSCSKACPTSPHVLQLVIRLLWRAFLVPLVRMDVVVLEHLLGHPPPAVAADVDYPVQEIEITRLQVLALRLVEAAVFVKV